MAHPSNRFVYQIFYDERSRLALDPGFLGFDNTKNERPDWFEFWVIRKFLRESALEEGSWYGFVSPRFKEKTGLDSSNVMALLEHCGPEVDVALFSPYWDLIAYFLNPFEHGEVFHPGLLALSQRFLERIGVDVDLRTLTTHSLSSVFCNFIVARPVFWRAWLRIADVFFEFVESGQESWLDPIRSATGYAPQSRNTPTAPMKTFIQERFASLVLALGGFRVSTIDMSPITPPVAFFLPHPQTRRSLQACNLLKQQYVLTKDPDYLTVYRKIRATIPTRLTPAA